MPEGSAEEGAGDPKARGVSVAERFVIPGMPPVHIERCSPIGRETDAIYKIWWGGSHVGGGFSTMDMARREIYFRAAEELEREAKRAEERAALLRAARRKLGQDDVFKLGVFLAERE